MCLLIVKPAGKSIPESYLRNAYITNSDGSGIAIARDNKLIIEKSAKWGDGEIHKILEQNKDYNAVVHFRWATHGKTNYDNTHPFQLNDDWVAAHNGMIPSVTTIGDESDTRAFLRQHVIPLLNVGVRLNDKDILTMLGKSMCASNKMAFLSADGSYGIANEASGHWLNGVWYSNHSYLPSQFPSSRYRKKDYYTTTTFPRKDVGVYSYPEEEIDDDPVGNNDEIWHTFDIASLYCDSCSQRIIGEFYVEQRAGLLYCHRCKTDI